MPDRKPLIAGNWKMNLDIDESVALAKGIVAEMKGLGTPEDLEKFLKENV